MPDYYMAIMNLFLVIILLINHFHHKRHLDYVDKAHKNISGQMMDVSLMIDKLKRISHEVDNK